MMNRNRTYLTITNPAKVSDIDARISFIHEWGPAYQFHYQDGIYQNKLRLFRDGFSNRYTLMVGLKSMQVEIVEILDMKQFVAKMLYMVEWEQEVKISK